MERGIPSFCELLSSSVDGPRYCGVIPWDAVWGTVCAIGISTWLRPRIGYTWWRRLHVLTLAIYALVTVHGIGTGSDTRTWWGLSIYLVSVVLVGSLLCRRLLAPANKRKHAPSRRADAASPGSPRTLEDVGGVAARVKGGNEAEAARVR